MKKLFVGILMVMVMVGVNGAINVHASNDLNNYYYNFFNQLHNNWMTGPAVAISFDYKNVKLIREEYYTNGKLNRIGAPAVVYSSVGYTFNNKSLPIYWRGAKDYYQEWWLDGERYTKTEYDKQLHK